MLQEKQAMHEMKHINEKKTSARKSNTCHMILLMAN
jgi:hypothetical protein